MLFLTLELLSSGDVGDVLKWKHMENDFLSSSKVENSKRDVCQRGGRMYNDVQRTEEEEGFPRLFKIFCSIWVCRDHC